MDRPSLSDVQALRELLGRGAVEAMRREEFEALLEWMLHELPAALPQPITASEGILRALCAHLAVHVWNGAPLPSNGYRPRKLPRPGRNDPCWCGSGAKFKRCCGQVGLESVSLPELDFWHLLVEYLTDEELARHAGAPDLQPDALVTLAREMRERGRSEQARAALAQALAPVTADTTRVDEGLVLALDELLDLEAAGRSFEGFRAYANELAERLPRALRKYVWRDLTCAAVAAGEIDTARDLIERLRAEAPDDPERASLEVMTFLEAGDYEQASRCADQWLAWMRRRRLDDKMAGEIEFLEQAARDPEKAARSLSAPDLAWLDDLAAWVEQEAERPIRPYDAQISGQECVFVAPPPGVAPAEEAWRRACPLDKPGLLRLYVDMSDPLCSDGNALLDVLRANPDALDSIDVVDDLVLLVDGAGDVDESIPEKRLLTLLLGRVERIVSATLAGGGDDLVVPWRFLENRQPLRLLAHYASHLEWLGKLELAERAFERVLRCNPPDEQGVREWLINRRLERGDDAGALAIAEQFPHDPLIATMFGRGLALWRLGRRDEAEAALRDAARRAPHALDELVRAHPSQPEPVEGSGACTHDDEASSYREAMRATWRATPDAFEFLRRSRRPR